MLILLARVVIAAPNDDTQSDGRCSPRAAILTTAGMTSSPDRRAASDRRITAARGGRLNRPAELAYGHHAAADGAADTASRHGRGSCAGRRHRRFLARHQVSWRATGASKVTAASAGQAIGGRVAGDQAAGASRYRSSARHWTNASPASRATRWPHCHILMAIAAYSPALPP